LHDKNPYASQSKFTTTQSSALCIGELTRYLDSQSSIDSNVLLPARLSQFFHFSLPIQPTQQAIHAPPTPHASSYQKLIKERRKRGRTFRRRKQNYTGEENWIKWGEDKKMGRIIARSPAFST
jgi:hypothetical protein